LASVLVAGQGVVNGGAVGEIGATQNHAPVANAGVDQTVTQGYSVTLSSS